MSTLKKSYRVKHRWLLIHSKDPQLLGDLNQKIKHNTVKTLVTRVELKKTSDSLWTLGLKHGLKKKLIMLHHCYNAILALAHNKAWDQPLALDLRLAHSYPKLTVTPTNDN